MVKLCVKGTSILLLTAWLAAPAAGAGGHFTVKKSAGGDGPDGTSPSGYVVYSPQNTSENRLVVEVPGVLSRAEGLCGSFEVPASGSGMAVRIEVPGFYTQIGPGAESSRSSPLRLVVDSSESLVVNAKEAGDRPLLAGYRLRDYIHTILTDDDVRDALGCLIDDARLEIERRVEEALPRTFDTLLVHHYRLDRANRSIDVEPGMQLCVEYAEHIRKWDGGHPKMYIGGPTHCYPVTRLRRDGRANTGRTVFNAYSSLFEGMEPQVYSTAVPSPNRGVAASMDLFDETPKGSSQYFRLFLPRTYSLEPDPTSGDPPQLTADRVPVLVGARCRGEIEVAETCSADGDLEKFCRGDLDGDWKDLHCVQGEKPCDGEQEWTRRCYKFRERGVPTPRIRVKLNGVAQYVAVGTTLYDVLETIGDVDAEELFALDHLKAANFQAGKILKKIEMKRRFNGSTEDVKFEDCGLGALYLPLLKGDSVKW